MAGRPPSQAGMVPSLLPAFTAPQGSRSPSSAAAFGTMDSDAAMTRPAMASVSNLHGDHSFGQNAVWYVKFT